VLSVFSWFLRVFYEKLNCFLSEKKGLGEVMGTERLRALVPFLLIDGVLVFAVLMLLQLLDCE